MLFTAIALHGICYDFFFVTGFMYTDRIAPKEIRGQAQGLLVFLTQGVGMYFGYQVAFAKNAAVTGYAPLNDAMMAERGTETLTFSGQLARMFSVDMPEGVDPGLIQTAMEQWKAFWMFPALMAGIVAVVFFLGFWDKTKVIDDRDEAP